jgi:hypothetical protein
MGVKIRFRVWNGSNMSDIAARKASGGVKVRVRVRVKVGD